MNKDVYLKKLDTIFSMIIFGLFIGLIYTIYLFCTNINTNVIEFIDYAPVLLLFTCIFIAYKVWFSIENRHVKHIISKHNQIQ